MELLPVELRAQLPPLKAQEKEKDPVLYIKFFIPDSSWTWYVAEGTPQDNDFLFFGYVFGDIGEWRSFRLSELESIRGPDLSPVERDRHFRPARWSEVKPYDPHEYRTS